MPDVDRRRLAIRGGCLVAVCGVAAAILIPTLAGVYDSSTPPDLPASLGPGNDCYYVMTPAESASMHVLSKCPRNDVPAQAPQSWLIRYYAFYDSTWYQGNVVPKSDQASYASYMATFGAQNATEIAAEAPDAEYVDTDGTIETGSHAGVSRDGRSVGGHDGEGGHGGGEGGGHGGGGGR